jgi:hypothetical protein
LVVLKRIPVYKTSLLILKGKFIFSNVPEKLSLRQWP